MVERDQAWDGTDADGLVGKVDDVTAALDGLSDVLAHEEKLPVILNRVCQQVRCAIPDADMASVSLLGEDDPETVAATDDQAIEIDKAQYMADEGPCLEAAKTGHVVRVTVDDICQRWPDFAAAAGAASVASYLSAPLFIDSEYRGSLNLYGRASHGFDKLDAALLELYTTAVEAALQSARRYLQARELAEHLRHALASRAVIDQALGVIMAARRIPADQAFAVLAKQSQQHNVKVRDIAQRFITGLLETGN